MANTPKNTFNMHDDDTLDENELSKAVGGFGVGAQPKATLHDADHQVANSIDHHMMTPTSETGFHLPGGEPHGGWAGAHSPGYKPIFETTENTPTHTGIVNHMPVTDPGHPSGINHIPVFNHMPGVEPGHFTPVNHTPVTEPGRPGGINHIPVSNHIPGVEPGHFAPVNHIPVTEPGHLGGIDRIPSLETGGHPGGGISHVPPQHSTELNASHAKNEHEKQHGSDGPVGKIEAVVHEAEHRAEAMLHKLESEEHQIEHRGEHALEKMGAKESQTEHRAEDMLHKTEAGVHTSATTAVHGAEQTTQAAAAGIAGAAQSALNSAENAAHQGESAASSVAHKVEDTFKKFF